MIGPFFSERLGKAELNCFQAYPGRGANITTRMAGDRVKLIGRARTVIEGVFELLITGLVPAGTLTCAATLLRCRGRISTEDEIA